MRVCSLAFGCELRKLLLFALDDGEEAVDLLLALAQLLGLPADDVKVFFLGLHI